MRMSAEQAEGMVNRGGMFLLGFWNVFFFSPRTGCGHVNHPGEKSEGPHTHLLVLVFIKKKKKKKKTKTAIFAVCLKVF